MLVYKKFILQQPFEFNSDFGSGGDPNDSSNSDSSDSGNSSSDSSDDPGLALTDCITDTDFWTGGDIPYDS